MKKKLIIAIVTLVVVLGGGIGGYVYHTNQVKAEKAANFKKALTEFRSNGSDMMYGLEFIMRDYIANWNGSIHNQKALDMNNKVVDCSDFSEAVSTRYMFYKKFGAFNTIDSVYIVLGKNLDALKQNASEEQADLVKDCNTHYKEFSNAITLAKEPNGSLMQFSINENKCFQKLHSYDRLLAQKVHLGTEDMEKAGVDVIDAIGSVFLTDRQGKSKQMKNEYMQRCGVLTEITWRLQNVDYEE